MNRYLITGSGNAYRKTTSTSPRRDSLYMYIAYQRNLD
jgi:hypothetical protein